MAVGLALLVVSIAGLFQRPSEVEQPQATWDRLDSALYRQTPSYEALLAIAANSVAGLATDEEKALALHDLVSRRFAQGVARHSLGTSYPRRFLSVFDEGFGYAYSRDGILRVGNQAQCGQQSYVLGQLAKDLGLVARQVGLNGHVVTEFWVDDRWIMLDPDFELSIRRGDGQLAGVRDLERQPQLAAAYAKRGRPEIVEAFRTRYDNTYVANPPGHYPDWKSNALARLSTVIATAKWMLPILLIAVGLIAFWSRPRSDAVAQ